MPKRMPTLACGTDIPQYILTSKQYVFIVHLVYTSAAAHYLRYCAAAHYVPPLLCCMLHTRYRSVRTIQQYIYYGPCLHSQSGVFR